MVNTLWVAMALFGLSLLVTNLPWLFWSIKIMGAAYLVWFGIQIFKRSAKSIEVSGAVTSGSSLPSAVRDGITTNLANPKSLAFYASVFSGAVPADASVET